MLENCYVSCSTKADMLFSNRGEQVSMDHFKNGVGRINIYFIRTGSKQVSGNVSIY